MLTWVIVAFIGVSLLNLGASYLQTYLTSWVGEHIIYDLRRKLFAHLQKLTLDFFSRQKTGWIVSRLTNDIDALDQLVTDGVTSLVTNSLTFIGAIVFLFILDWRLALATLSIMPFLIVATLIFRAKSARRLRAGAQQDRRRERAPAGVHLSGMRVIKAFRREDSDYARLAVANAAYRDVNYRTVVQSGLYFPFVEFMSAAAVVIVLWYGGSLVSGQALQIGVLVAFIGYLNSFFDPLQQLSQLYNTFQASMAAVQKIYTVLDTDPDMQDAPDAVDLPDVRGEVELRPRDLRLRRRPRRCCTTSTSRIAGRRDRRARRRHRRRQVDGHQAAGALLRPDRGRGPRRRARPARRHACARCASSWRSCRRRPSCSAARCWTTSASPGRRPSDEEVKRVARIVGVHDFVDGAARRLRDRGAGGRVGAEHRAAAAHQLRAGAARRPAHPDPRRGDLAAWTPRASAASSAPWRCSSAAAPASSSRTG